MAGCVRPVVNARCGHLGTASAGAKLSPPSAPAAARQPLVDITNRQVAGSCSNVNTQNKQLESLQRGLCPSGSS